MGAFLLPTTPFPTQPRTYGTEDLLEDRDRPIDEPIFPDEETSTEEDDGDRNEDGLEIGNHRMTGGRMPMHSEHAALGRCGRQERFCADPLSSCGQAELA
jgi:hypothetical protein